MNGQVADSVADSFPVARRWKCQSNRRHTGSAVRDLALELIRNSGEKRLMLLPEEIVDPDGTSCFVKVTRDVTELNRFELTPQ